MKEVQKMRGYQPTEKTSPLKSVPKGGSSGYKENKIMKMPIMILKPKEIIARKSSKSLYELSELIRCEDCKFIRWYEDEDEGYYYCALENRPNRNWSVDETDFCSWAEREE